MKISFSKYQGTGNDFVMIDNRTGFFDRKARAVVERLCDRRFGIGADGLILLQSHPQYDFEMVYFNADGNESTMCGNGGRCLVAFAHQLGIVEQSARFWAVDGEHEAVLTAAGDVALRMVDVPSVVRGENFYWLQTGSPHYVRFVADVAAYDVHAAGRAVRYSEPFRAEGVNVNFVEIKSLDAILVATYERGVEGETLSCGTGVTAAALAFYAQTGGAKAVNVTTKGGALRVRFEAAAEGGFADIWLEGGATFVFEGTITV